jgi:hypothetical protein
VLHFSGKRGRLKGSAAADVEASQKNHEGHEFLLLETLLKGRN